MPSFHADLLSPMSARLPSMRLTYESNRPSEPPLRIFLTLARRINESQLQRFPVYYRFLPPVDQVTTTSGFTITIPNSQAQSRLVLIVAPGVSVRIGTMRSIYRRSNSLTLEIYRIQDPSLVPTLGRRFNTEYFLRRFTIDTLPPRQYVTGTLTANGMEAQYYDSRVVSSVRHNEYLTNLIRGFGQTILTVSDPVGDIHNNIIAVFGSQSDRAAASRGIRHQILESPYVFEFSERNDGLIIEHPNSGQRLIIECPMFHWQDTISEDKKDHEARFSWDIEQNESGVYQVRVMKTAAVRVTLHVNFDILAHTNESTAQFQNRVTLPVFDVKDADFNDIPLLGNSLPWGRGRAHTNMTVVLPSSVDWLQSIADVALGFIPGIGDAVDIAEFIYALRTDQDRWGHQVSTFEKTIMGAGAVISLVGPSIASFRRLSDLARSSQGLTGLTRPMVAMEQPFNRMVRRLQNANLSIGDRRFIEQVSELLRNGARLSADQIARAKAIMERLPVCPV